MGIDSSLFAFMHFMASSSHTIVLCNNNGIIYEMRNQKLLGNKQFIFDALNIFGTCLMHDFIICVERTTQIVCVNMYVCYDSHMCWLLCFAHIWGGLQWSYEFSIFTHHELLIDQKNFIVTCCVPFIRIGNSSTVSPENLQSGLMHLLNEFLAQLFASLDNI